MTKVLKSVSILNVHFVLVNRICVMSTPTTYMTMMMMHVTCVRSSTVNFAKGQAERETSKRNSKIVRSLVVVNKVSSNI